MGIRTRTMLDKSTRNLATMLAEGSGQGVLDCKRAEKDYPTASPGAMQLCHELGRFQSEAEQTGAASCENAFPLGAAPAGACRSATAEGGSWRGD